MRIFTGTLTLALAIVLNYIGLGSQMENDSELQGEVRRIQSSDLRRITILHCLPNIAPLILVRKLVGTEFKEFTERTTLLKKGDFVYAWDKGGVVTELYDRSGHLIVLEGLAIRRVKSKDVFLEAFGIGESVSALATAAQYPAYPVGTSRPTQ